MERAYLIQVLIVGTGGFIGSGLRFTVGGWVQRMFTASQFPYGTLTVNAVGCLLIGYLAGIAELRQALDPATRLFLVAGILGGFTTFSAFAFESLSLALDYQYMKAMLNTVLQVAIGITAAWIGFGFARLMS
jgi:CrcB protein